MSEEDDASKQIEKLSVTQNEVNDDETGQDTIPGAASNNRIRANTSSFVAHAGPASDFRTRANTSSFAAPTEASMAKQNEKVELANLWKPFSTKDSANHPNTSPALNSAQFNTSHRSRGRKNHRDDVPSEREKPSTATGREESYSYNQSRALDAPQESGLGEEEKLEEEQNLKTQVERWRGQKVEQDRKNQVWVTDSNTTKEDADDHFNKVAGKLQDFEDRIHSLHSLRKLGAKTQDEKGDDQAVDDDTSEDAERSPGERDSPNREAVEAEHESSRVAFPDPVRIITGLYQDLNQRSAEVSSANLHAEQAEEKLETSNAVLQTLKRHIEHACSIVHQQDQTMSGSLETDWNMLDAFASSLPKSDPDPGALHSKFAWIVNWFIQTIHSLHEQNQELQNLLRDKEYDLAVARSTVRGSGKDALAEMSGAKPTWQADRDTFEKLFIAEREQKNIEKLKYQKFKETAEKWYQPDIEKKYRELQIDFTSTEKENTKLREKVKEYRSKAQQWENEYRIAKSDRETRTAGFEEQLKKQQTEILFYIQEYHDKTHDSGHWELEGLQKKIQALERDRYTTNEILDQSKRDRARLEDEVRRLMDAMKSQKNTIARLGRAYITGGSTAPTLIDTASSDPGSPDSLSDTDSSSSILWLTSPKKVDEVKVPRCHLLTEVEKREEKMGLFREEQRKKRERWAAREEELEALRRERLGALYPPEKNGWEELMKKDCWERWRV